MPNIYLAGPISGGSYDEATNWREYVEKELWAAGLDCINPMRGKSYLKKEEAIANVYPGTTMSASKAIFARDAWDVDRCDLVLVNLLDSERISIGTCVEIGMAFARGKPIVLCVNNDTYNHPFIMEPASFSVGNLDSGVEVCKMLFREYMPPQQRDLGGFLE